MRSFFDFLVCRENFRAAKVYRWRHQTRWSSFTQYVGDFYRPERSCGQGNIFTPVCHSVHGGGGVCFSACWDTSPPEPDPPGEDTPPGSRPPPNYFFFKFIFCIILLFFLHPPGSRLRHTVNERPVHILLECILVFLVSLSLLNVNIRLNSL